MGDINTLQVFNAQVTNIKGINSCRKILRKKINDCYANNHIAEANALTKLYCLLYSTWAEATFLKLINTPYGFDLNQIEQIIEHKNKRIGLGWEKCLELAFGKVQSWNKAGDLPNHLQKIRQLIEEYVISTATLRNKFAHGQWEVALNSDNNKVNNEISNEILKLDIVTIDKWFFIYERLAFIIEILIESPEVHYRNNYYTEIIKVEEFINESNTNTLSKKIKSLQEKRGYFKNRF